MSLCGVLGPLSYCTLFFFTTSDEFIASWIGFLFVAFLCSRRYDRSLSLRAPAYDHYDPRCRQSNPGRFRHPLSLNLSIPQGRRIDSVTYKSPPKIQVLLMSLGFQLLQLFPRSGRFCKTPTKCHIENMFVSSQTGVRAQAG